MSEELSWEVQDEYQALEEDYKDDNLIVLEEANDQIVDLEQEVVEVELIE